MSIVPFSLELAQQLYDSVERFPVDFDEAWEWLGYSRKDNAKRFFEKAGFVEGIDFEVFLMNEENPSGGRPLQKIKLTAECLKQWGMMAGTEKGKEVRFYFLECERIAKAATQSMSTADLLLMYAQAFKEHEERLAAIEQENQEIKHQLEAIDMETVANTAELERFRNGHGFWMSIAGWCSNHGIKKPLQWMNVQGRKASALCKAKGIQPVKVTDPRFGTVNTYPDSVLAELLWD